MVVALSVWEGGGRRSNYHMDTLNFSRWLEHSAPKIGIVKTRPVLDQIEAIDQAIRKLAGTDPLASVSRILGAYSERRPLPPKD